jgi:hypothetical protein
MSYRNFWGCEIAPGESKVVAVDDHERLNLSQACTRSQRCELCTPAL